MDTQTVAAYDTLAETFAQEWREQPAPEDMYALFRREFKAGGATADIGCGAGREVAWLNANGYPAVGYDASAGLLLVETSHRTDLEMPKPAAAAPDVCAEADRGYAISRMMFFDGGFAAGTDRRRMTTRFAVPPECAK